MPTLKQQINGLGTLKSLSFMRESKGERIYELWFDRGRMIVGIRLSVSGRIEGMRLSQHLYR